MNYEIYFTEPGEKRVKFENGRTRCVKKDKNGYEYFSIINTKNENKLGLFSGRIKDAIEAIREGEGDCLEINNLFGKHEHVIKFLDRECGENLRQQTIKGWEGTEFGYSLKFGYKNSFNNYLIKNDETALCWGDNQSDAIYFNTEKEAEEYKTNIIKKAEEFANKYSNVLVNNKNNKEKVYEWLAKNYNDTVSFKIGSEMVESDKQEWFLEIVQVVKPEQQQLKELIQIK